MEILRKWAQPVLAALCAIFTALACIFPVASGMIKLIAFDLFNPMLHGGDIRILIGGVLGVVALICGVIGLIIVAINVFAKKGKLQVVLYLSISTVAYGAYSLFVLKAIGNIAFVPAIIVAVLTIAYFVCGKVFAAKAE